MTQRGTPGKRYALTLIIARLSPTGGPMVAIALVVAVVLAGCGSSSAATTPTASMPTVAAASLP